MGRLWNSILTQWMALAIVMAVSAGSVRGQMLPDQFLTVIAVVDAGPDQASLASSWNSFRSSWPDRAFCVLGVSARDEDLLIPLDMARDPNVIISNANRDAGDTWFQSNWFNLCDMASRDVSSVGLLIGVPEDDVAASLSYFEDQLLHAFEEAPHIAIPQEDNNWIEPLSVSFLASEQEPTSSSGAPSDDPPTTNPNSSAQSPAVEQGPTPTEEEKEDQTMTVIAVVDTGGPDQASIASSWNSFRSSWPDRAFCVLVVSGGEDLLIPVAMARDPNVIISNVNRDAGDAWFQSNWFNLCNMASRDVSSIGLLIGVLEDDVEASLSYFESQLIDTPHTVAPQGDNNWIEPLSVSFMSSA